MAKTKKVDAEDTKEKICEAQYFLDRMVESQNGPNPFKYNLSAFLGAFRSMAFYEYRAEGYQTRGLQSEIAGLGEK